MELGRLQSSCVRDRKRAAWVPSASCWPCFIEKRCWDFPFRSCVPTWTDCASDVEGQRIADNANRPLAHLHQYRFSVLAARQFVRCSHERAETLPQSHVSYQLIQQKQRTAGAR